MFNFKYYDVQQNTDEWFKMRSGKLTSSKLGTIMANFGKAFGDPAKKYAVNIAVEQINGESIDNGFSNGHMERGHEQEPTARMLYELETFCEVKNGGFFGSDLIGCSPDGLPENGVIEIKSVIPSAHYANLKRQSFDPAYKWQCIGNLMFTGRDWIDFVSYCSEFPEEKQLFVHRGFKEDFTDEFEKIEFRISEFMELISSTKELILNSSYFNQ